MTRKARRSSHHGKPTFAGIVNDVREHSPEPGSPEVGYPTPIPDGQWTDADGTVWHMRGQPLNAKQARRLMERPETTVLHSYLDDPTIVTGPDRTALFGRINQYLAGNAPPMAEFTLAEFRDSGRVMLVVNESC